MSLSCSIRASGSAREGVWLAAECEQGEGDEGFGSMKAEQGVGEPRVEGVIDRHAMFHDLAGELDESRHA